MYIKSIWQGETVDTTKYIDSNLLILNLTSWLFEGEIYYAFKGILELRSQLIVEPISVVQYICSSILSAKSYQQKNILYALGQFFITTLQKCF